MPGDPVAFRENAARVARLADEMTDPEMKTALLDLAETWTELAHKLDAVNKMAGDLLSGRDTHSRLPANTKQ
jgi:hypothetical protein